MSVYSNFVTAMPTLQSFFKHRENIFKKINVALQQQEGRALSFL